MTQVLSTAYIKVDGELLRSLPGAKIKLGGTKREPVVGASSMHGYAETFEPSMIECEVSVVPGFSVARLQKITGATVTFEGDTGQTWVVRDAFCTETLEVNGADGGKVALKFAGQPAEEMLA